MAKHVQVLVSCDWCHKRWPSDDEEAPLLREWSWNGQEYSVELCADCLPKVREHLAPLFESSEQKNKRKRGRPKLTPDERATRLRRKLLPGAFEKYKNADGKYECPAEDCERTFEYAQHLGSHHHSAHGRYLD